MKSINEEIERIKFLISEGKSKKLYYHGRTKSRPYDGDYIFITDNLGYASGYSDGNEIYVYTIPFNQDKIFSIKNPNHLEHLREFVDNYTINEIINSSGKGQEIDWATLSYISTDDFEMPEDLFQHMGFLGIKLKERENIESIYIFNQDNLKFEGKISTSDPKVKNEIIKFYSDFQKDKNFL